jgi:hypothetical protein
LSINQSNGADKDVPRDGLILGIGCGEMRAGDEAGAEGEEEKSAGEEKRFCGGTRE